MTRTGLIGVVLACVLAIAHPPAVAEAQGAGATKAQMTKKKAPATAASGIAATTGREAKEKTCLP